MNATLLKVIKYPPAEDFQGATVVNVLDPEAGETLRLSCDETVAAELETWPAMTEGRFALTARQFELRSVGAKGGRAFRLKIFGAERADNG